MSYEVLNSEKQITENTTAGTVITYQVWGVAGSVIVFQGTNQSTFTNPVEIVRFTLSTTGVAESVVLVQSWKKLKGVVLSGDADFIVTCDQEV